MSEWKEYSLEEITEPIKETYIPTGNDKFTYIGLEHIEQESLRLNGIGKSTDVTSNKFKFNQNDVLFGKLRPYFRKVVKPKFSGICSTDIWVLRSKKDINQHFLFYFIANWDFVNVSNGGEGGTRMPRADWNFLKQTKWTLPPLPEQTAIASVLSSLDDKIDLLHRQNATLEKMAETLFRQWFLPAGAPAQAGVEEAKEEWKMGKLGDFAKTNVSTIGRGYSYEYIEYLDTSSLTGGVISNLQLLNIKEAPSRAKRLVQHNDILISTVRPDQKHYGIIKYPKPNLVVSTGFCVVTCISIGPHFVYLLLTSNEMTDYLHSIAEGSTSTYPSLKPSDIEKIEFQIPPKERLEEFEELTANHFEKIKSNQTQIRTLTALRDTLLPKLMSGELRVL